MSRRAALDFPLAPTALHRAPPRKFPGTELPVLDLVLERPGSILCTRRPGEGIIRGRSGARNMSTAVIRVRSASEVALDLVQREYPNYHPLISLARLAHRADVMEDPKLELEVHKTILPYVAPKLSSVEVRTSDPDDRRVIVSLFEERALEDGRIVDVEVPLVTDVTDVVGLD